MQHIYSYCMKAYRTPQVGESATYPKEQGKGREKKRIKIRKKSSYTLGTLFF